MKKCPYCAEEIQDAAIKCRYCGEAVPANAPVVVVSDEWRAYCQRVHGLSEWQRRLELEKLDQDWERRDQYETACKALGYEAFDSPRAQQRAEILDRAPRDSRWPERANRIGIGIAVVMALVSVVGLSLMKPDTARKKRATIAAGERAEPGRNSGLGRENKARAALAYLTDGTVSEVQWVEHSGNNVYVGFSPRPSDLQMVVNGAAFKCNKAIDFGCHVWAVDARKASRSWRPGQAGLTCEATARHGRVTDSDC